MVRFESKPINLVLMQIVGPALIILMVSSLVFFFIEVVYRGPHTARLYWVMGLFTFAAVLVSRISIQEGRERAQLFGLALALATMIACLQLVQFAYGGLSFLGPVVTVGLLATVMWSSSKLTWDCTVIDRSRDASATGLVDLFRQRFRMDPAPQTTPQEKPERANPFDSLLRWIAGTKQKNTPGLWVFYFAVFAFPVFGLGQWFVRSESKTWVYMLFAVYLGSSLCLLMTTSLLGLERYLAKRKLHVPEAVARNWMIVGGVFALSMVILVMLIPKPASSGRIQNWLTVLTTPVRDASKLAQGHDGQRDDPNAQKQQFKKDAERQANEGSGQEGDGGNNKNNQSSKQQKPEDASDKSSNSERQNERGRSKHQRAQNQSENRNKNRDTHAANKDERESKRPNNRSEPKPQAHEKNPSGQRQPARQGNPPPNQEQDRRKPQAKHRPQHQADKLSLSKITEVLSKGIRFLVYALGILAVIYLLWVFRNEWAKLWAAWFGKQQTAAQEKDPSPTELKQPLPSYRSFQDPFRSGRANSMRAKQLLEYTREALEAWSREFGVEALPFETLEDLSKKIVRVDPRVSKYARQFGDVYGRSAFSLDSVSREELNPLIKLWRSMDRAVAEHRRPTVAAMQ